MVLVVALATSCSHTLFQFRPSGAQAEALDAAVVRFVAAADHSEGSALTADLDLEARKALLQLAVHLALTKTEPGRKISGMLVALLVVFAVLAFAGGDKDDVEGLLDCFRSMAAPLAEQLIEEFGGPGAGDARSGEAAIDRVSAAAADRSRETPGDRAQRITSGAFPSPTGGSCHAAWKVSYRASVLDHLDSEPFGRTYHAWKAHARAVHLFAVRCAGLDGAVLFADYQDRPGVGLVAWHFVTHEQWPRIESRIDRTLELK